MVPKIAKKPQKTGLSNTSSSGVCQYHTQGPHQLVRNTLLHPSIYGDLTACYSRGLNLKRLKAQCKSRRLKVGGKKSDLVSHLENDDSQQVSRWVLSSFGNNWLNWHSFKDPCIGAFFKFSFSCLGESWCSSHNKPYTNGVSASVNAS